MNELSTRLKSALAAPSFEGIRKSVFFHPSSASVEYDSPTGRKVVGSCLREQYYRITDEPTTAVGEVDYSISAMIGDKISELVVNLIDAHGFKMGLQRLAVEHSFFDPRINVSGRCDIIAWDYINNEPVGLEVKSVGEYKASKTILEPSEEHVMQAVIYLDYYRTFMPQDKAIPKKWYIWYVSRTENYQIKAKKHNSPLTMLWDYYVTLDDAGVPTVHTPSGNKKLEHLAVPKIHDRYQQLASYLTEKTLPPRDFDLKYSVEKIVTLHQLKELTRKADIEAVDKWLEKGAKEGKLKIEMGDFECRLCAWKEECWGLPKVTSTRQKFNLPDKTEPPKVAPRQTKIIW